jgi:hypothetical protein
MEQNTQKKQRVWRSFKTVDEVVQYLQLGFELSKINPTSRTVLRRMDNGEFKSNYYKRTSIKTEGPLEGYEFDTTIYENPVEAVLYWVKDFGTINVAAREY